MDASFSWSPPINQEVQRIAEKKILQDLDKMKFLAPCHTGPISIFLSSDPLEVSIRGFINCRCGKTIATVTGAADASSLTFSEVK